MKLTDFFHLPGLVAALERIVAEGAQEGGMILVAGLDTTLAAASPTGEELRPSGHMAVLRILLQGLLEQDPALEAWVVAANRQAVRLPRQLGQRVHWLLTQPPFTAVGRVAAATRQQHRLLVIHQLERDVLPAALEAARQGMCVLTQVDTLFRGADVARELLDWGIRPEQLDGLRWIVTMQRMPALCPQCRRPLPADERQYFDELYRRFSHLVVSSDILYGPAGCDRCGNTGWLGDVAAFDVFRSQGGAVAGLDRPSLLPMSDYVCELARLGMLPPGYALRLDTDLLRRVYRMFAAGQATLAQTNAAMQRKVAELEAANRVLQRQTEALFSLHDIGHALIASNDLQDLSERVCRHACTLCGAERAVLYLARWDDRAEILAVSGWDRSLVGQQLDARQVFGAASVDQPPQPVTLGRLPPGIAGEMGRVALKAGLRVPLIAQGQRVGAMIVHALHKSSFAPGDVSLLQTFANQAALAIQRAGLVAQLRDKIAQLEAAQSELARKERMERELELARQVQQSVLPRVFPQVDGYVFAAQNEPARQVGGDFYDVISLGPSCFALVIADVSDKGMPAALYMALTRSLILAEAQHEARRAQGEEGLPSPCHVLSSVNQLLLQLGQSRMFVTVFYGVVDVRRRRMRYVRAGHDRPILLRSGQAQPLGGRGTFLGFWETGMLGLTEEQIDLQPGDRLVLYTDGLTDACAPDGQIFDRQRLSLLLQAHAAESPDAFCATIFADLTAFRSSADQFDDMTMLVMQVGSE